MHIKRIWTPKSSYIAHQEVQISIFSYLYNEKFTNINSILTLTQFKSSFFGHQRAQFTVDMILGPRKFNFSPPGALFKVFQWKILKSLTWTWFKSSIFWSPEGTIHTFLRKFTNTSKLLYQTIRSHRVIYFLFTRNIYSFEVLVIPIN